MKSERDAIIWHTMPHLEHENAIDVLSVNTNDEDFVELLSQTQQAIDVGINPILITTGSSGSYFVRNKDGENIGVFKPKDEEPFAEHNPKWPKYFQRFLCFCCFGRACLIPKSGFLSEAGASLVDERFQLRIVPKTRIIRMAAPTFFYPKRLCGREELRPKIGSYQVFVHGYKPAIEVASEWMADDPRCTLTDDERSRFLYLFQKMCILDYVIRNTDRNNDNWLIKYVPGSILELAAIDHGLAFPVKHPEIATRLRPYPFAWGTLPLARKQWDESLRKQMLELLSPLFVHRLCLDVKRLFICGGDNNRFLVENQIDVMRGQIWNLRLSLLAKESPADMLKRDLLVVTAKYRGRPQSNEWDECFRANPPDSQGRGCC
ncbi:Phosphatidylinositol 4-kinase type 2-beta [Toxocara canis]|uniref:Phosphatidylinositol 4-kinase type 2 n=2 Tax=Toxocara canis TaxID=6265 RepID=A0A0B2V8K7_TOXCA|nr:Phosphatidylinositol 4-kinase type 2-beta [Toxocara canis]VDM47181.1 unnamed protein product [Toxocara canis]